MALLCALIDVFALHYIVVVVNFTGTHARVLSYSEAYGSRLFTVLSRVETVPLPTPMSRDQAQAIVKRLPPISSRLTQRIRSKEKSQRVAENTNGDATGGWYCSVCTFHNERRFNRCTMCQQGIRGM